MGGEWSVAVLPTMLHRSVDPKAWLPHFDVVAQRSSIPFPTLPLDAKKRPGGRTGFLTPWQQKFSKTWSHFWAQKTGPKTEPRLCVCIGRPQKRGPESGPELGPTFCLIFVSRRLFLHATRWKRLGRQTRAGAGTTVAALPATISGHSAPLTSLAGFERSGDAG